MDGALVKLAMRVVTPTARRQAADPKKAKKGRLPERDSDAEKDIP